MYASTLYSCVHDLALFALEFLLSEDFLARTAQLLLRKYTKRIIPLCLKVWSTISSSLTMQSASFSKVQCSGLDGSLTVDSPSWLPELVPHAFLGSGRSSCLRCQWRLLCKQVELALHGRREDGGEGTATAAVSSLGRHICTVTGELACAVVVVVE